MILNSNVGQNISRGGVILPNYIGDAKDEEYEMLRKMGEGLRIPTPEAFLTFTAKLKDEVVHEHTERAHSWVRNGYNILVSTMCEVDGSGATFGAGYINIKDSSGTVKYGNFPIAAVYNVNVESVGNSYGYLCPSGNAGTGIIIGTGTTAYSFEDYALASLIATGTSTGQMTYGASQAPMKVYDSGTKIYTVVHSRDFTNSSGAAIIVAETGLRGTFYCNSTSYYPLVMRDVLSSTVSVSNLVVLTVTYTMQVTFPA